MSQKVTVRVAAAQMVSKPEDVASNVAKALSYCDRAARKGVQILCFPECASTGYDWITDRKPADSIHAEPVPGPMVHTFADKARETGMYIIFGVVERPEDSPRVHNTAFLVGPEEGYIGRYRKALTGGPFTDGAEADVFTTRYGKIGIFICADMRSPELSRLLVLRGARVLFQPTNYFYRDAVDIKRRYLGKVAAQRARAMDNGVHVVVANAGRSEYVNNSRVITPAHQGPERNLARATRREQLVVADIEYDLEDNAVLNAAGKSPWLFRELGEEMLKAAER